MGIWTVAHLCESPGSLLWPCVVTGLPIRLPFSRALLKKDWLPQGFCSCDVAARSKWRERSWRWAGREFGREIVRMGLTWQWVVCRETFFKSLEQHNNVVSFMNCILQTKWGPSYLPHCSRNPLDSSFCSNSYLLQCPLKGWLQHLDLYSAHQCWSVNMQTLFAFAQVVLGACQLAFSFEQIYCFSLWHFSHRCLIYTWLWISLASILFESLGYRPAGLPQP